MPRSAVYRKISIWFAALCRHFDDETSVGTKDISGILVKRYGIERAFANKEIVSKDGINVPETVSEPQPFSTKVEKVCNKFIVWYNL